MSGLTLPIIRSRKHKLIFISLAVIVMAVISGAVYYLTSRDVGATLDGFQAGNIMGDAVMSNKGAMSESQIQSFLKSKADSCTSKGPYSSGSYYYDKLSKSSDGKTAYSGSYVWNIKNGHFVCMADDKFGGETAAHIIWQAAQDYNVNPQVLIVLLQKEQGLVTDGFPNNHQYLAATGYDCPDNGNGCNNANAGFKTQIRKAAALFHEVLTGGWTNYPVGSNFIKYNPSDSCGGTVVNVANRATSALYRYTPYQPNKAALNAGYGSGNSCSAYGNRNFYNYFTDWFGSTFYNIRGSIGELYNSVGVSELLGIPTENESKISGGGYKQCFQNGCIAGSGSTGYWIIKGSIGKYYWANQGASGKMMLPLANEVSAGNSIYYQKYQGGYIIGRGNTGYWSVRGSIGKLYTPDYIDTIGVPLREEESVGNAWQQQFDNGYILGSSKTGYWVSSGDIRTFWLNSGGFNGRLGLPTGATTNTDESNYKQSYQGGIILGNSSTGYWDVKGSIYSAYESLGEQNSPLGLPLASESSQPNGVWSQQFQNGYIIGSHGQYFESSGAIRNYWLSLDAQNGKMGLPTAPVHVGTTGNATWQYFNGGVIIVNPKDNSAWESRGSIRTVWASLGYQNGQLGYPTGPEQYNASNKTWSQTYEYGTIVTKNGAKYSVTFTH